MKLRHLMMAENLSTQTHKQDSRNILVDKGLQNV